MGNKLRLNLNKTRSMILPRSIKNIFLKNIDLNVKIEKKIIKNKNCYKHLGMNIDINLKWSELRVY